ncbi:hypothetical protein [Pseudomonas sp. TH31]|uniref:hypothetical protein n=1 Tax=Pseudomonas sp. TH31 TaxID=2796396 RepID=UPI0019129A80|nr:hypothetical protein [Pseudomonas sp. TH31]MBK5413384.1 hypothetical protein [Pseudomonas sp. TH31]
MAVRPENAGALEAAFAGEPRSYGSDAIPARDEARKNDEKSFTIIPVDMHHRNESLPQKTVRRRISPLPNANPVPEGQTMLIHLLTCLALTTVTLTLFSRFFLDIDPSEEHPS